ncbi:hypothetical protein EUX98_g4766 [Antrodiella citrinella]|uniref:Uncharacterized protein n=1 Tax=Antrodiella citrinella TaxID=2447956 RepID=A0A4S4N165_9APHY|nr:hypothetical protein EUX98_g4766 [Antrodiella citrinella]
MADAIVSPPIIPQRRPRDEPEIIDVDSLDDDIVITGYGRNQRRRLSPSQPESSRAAASRYNNREVIVLSDDEGEGSSASSRPSGSRHRLVSPPPPARQHYPVPPVPSFPLRFMFPRRSRSRAPRPHPPPAIAPNPDPFDFEAHLFQPPPPRQPTPPIVLPPRGAPVSHHQPVMGLGGAILALNRSARMPGHHGAGLEQHRQDRDADPVRPARGYGYGYGFNDLSSWVTDFFGSRRRPEPRPRPAYDFWPLADLEFERFAEDMPSMEEMLAEVRQPKVPEVMWKPEYTHNGTPHTGFTYNFSEEAPPSATAPTCVAGSSSAQAIVIPDDDDTILGSNIAGPSRVKSESPSGTGFTLACARCTAPLVLAEDDRHPLSTAERKSRRVWGLRCGHVLDGKCIESIMRPPVSVSVSDEKGKGKARIVSGDALPSPKRRGKARAGMYSHAILDSEPPKDEALEQLLPENSMRARLRPRHPRSDTASAASVSGAQSQVAASLQSPSRRREARDSRASHPYAKSKGKGRARKPVVLDEFEWTCPVAGCGRVHRSVHLKDDNESVDGGWSMDPERGAVAMFI